MFDYLNYTLCYIHNGDASTQDGTLFLWGTDWTFQYYVRSLQLKITPLRRVLLAKLTCPQLVRKSPAFYRIRKLITAFTTARQVSLSWARSIQSLPLLPISSCVILILVFHVLLYVLSACIWWWRRWDCCCCLPRVVQNSPLISRWVRHVLEMRLLVCAERLVSV